MGIWVLPPSVLAPPEPGEVHVWRAETSVLPGPDLAILSADEAERARRFRTAEDRRRFAVTRAMLRAILGRYLGQPPAALRFNYGELGKPTLDDACNPAKLTFNVSHSGDYALLAFARDIAVGVDVEHLLIERNTQGIARRLLAPTRYDQWLRMPEPARKRELLQAWTRREAVGKALGIGVSAEQEPNEHAISDLTDWSISDLDIAAGYVGTLAVRARQIEVRLWECKQ